MVGESLSSLETLRRDWIHVFVAGPGQGEGIAIALPKRGWLLIDGCGTGERFPLEEIVKRWRGPAEEDPIHAMVLTHPHHDHVEGFAELIDALQPERIAVTAGQAPGETLLRTTRALLGGRAGENTHGTLLSQKVLAAIVALERWEEKNPGCLLGLTEGQTLLTHECVSICARAPHVIGLTRFLKKQGLERRLQQEANHISLVLELRFGNLCLLLTGDLPYLRGPKGGEIPTGWSAVSARHPHLGAHQGLKIPHHGSAEAMHPGWMTPRMHSARAWLVTPYNSSALPQLTRLEGLPRLLSVEPEVLLTAVPASKQVQAIQPALGQVRIGQLVTRTVQQKAGRSFLEGGTDIRPGSAVGPLDPLWCVAFDKGGSVQGKWRGQAAIAVTP